MCTAPYDMTYTDLNPKFLFSCIQQNVEENQYHSHDFIELVIVMKGHSSFLIDGQEYHASEGDLLLINPGTHHKRIIPEDAPTATECYVGLTDVNYVDCRKDALPLFCGRQIMVSFPEALRKELFYLCNAINKEANSCETGRYFMVKAYLLQMLCLIERYRRQEIRTEDPQIRREAVRCEFKSINKKYVIRRITDYMETHYWEKISLDQIAENMYLSSYYISKLFKSETGDTPINYLISLRMNKAKEMLEQRPDCAIQEVAAAVGYEDAYHFSKLFKKYYGISPLYYKARLR